MSDEPDLPPATALLHLVNGYQATQALYVAARLGLADLLRDGPRSSDDLARLTDTHAPSLYRLLRALAAFGVFQGGLAGDFALAPLGAYLHPDSPDSLRDLVLMRGSENFWQTWSELLHCVRTGESAMSRLFGAENPFGYYARNPEVAATVGAGMSVLARICAAAVVAAYHFPSSGTVVEVGGGHGQLLSILLKAYPGLRGVLFDLSPSPRGPSACWRTQG